MPNQIFNRILITRLKYIGDIILTTPLIKNIRLNYPNAYIAYLGDKKGVSLLDGNPHLDEIISFDFSKEIIYQQMELFYKLHSKKFDLAIDLYSNPRSALLTYATGAKVRIGYDKPGRNWAYTDKVKDDGKLKSAIDHHNQVLKVLDIEPKNYETEIFLSDSEKKEAERYLNWQGVKFEKPLVAIHPGATWKNKILPKEKFAELIDLIGAKLGAEIILSLGPNDEELKNYILQNTFAKVHALRVLPVRQLAAVLSFCKIFISNDCGPMHIGPAISLKTIGIFGPEPPEVWFPYNESNGHKFFFSKIDCSPCRKTECHLTGNDYLKCMKLISVDEIFNCIKERF